MLKNATLNLITASKFLCIHGEGLTQRLVDFQTVILCFTNAQCVSGWFSTGYQPVCLNRNLIYISFLSMHNGIKICKITPQSLYYIQTMTTPSLTKPKLTNLLSEGISKHYFGYYMFNIMLLKVKAQLVCMIFYTTRLSKIFSLFSRIFTAFNQSRHKNMYRDL